MKKKKIDLHMALLVLYDKKYPLDSEGNRTDDERPSKKDPRKNFTKKSYNYNLHRNRKLDKATDDTNSEFNLMDGFFNDIDEQKCVEILKMYEDNPLSNNNHESNNQTNIVNIDQSMGILPSLDQDHFHNLNHKHELNNSCFSIQNNQNSTIGVIPTDLMINNNNQNNSDISPKDDSYSTSPSCDSAQIISKNSAGIGCVYDQQQLICSNSLPVNNNNSVFIEKEIQINENYQNPIGFCAEGENFTNETILSEMTFCSMVSDQVSDNEDLANFAVFY
ncbi:hypothetical protein TRFO_15842 [Tritrichomonas foetus]|uniref:Uncharacterized protein n=1 Tax=Tritrichomonas foetus TaxID=1144522 RepID=A0A1J4KRQ0_9EUKA|nr:hypothetical protein TRFO_15842 [Tritrichomonas foetus]|eukprot:OHT13939.1 hypothetical protein TRFO_15842 [Tritrichomonas foetus]